MTGLRDEDITRLLRLRDFVEARQNTSQKQPIDLQLEEEFKNMKRCQHFTIDSSTSRLEKVFKNMHRNLREDVKKVLGNLDTNMEEKRSQTFNCQVFILADIQGNQQIYKRWGQARKLKVSAELATLIEECEETESLSSLDLVVSEITELKIWLEWNMNIESCCIREILKIWIAYFWKVMISQMAMKNWSKLGYTYTHVEKYVLFPSVARILEIRKKGLRSCKNCGKCRVLDREERVLLDLIRKNKGRSTIVQVFSSYKYSLKYPDLYNRLL